MRILYADDHSLIREALKPHLMKLRAKTEVIEAGSLDEALQYAKDVDLVLLDLQMPGMNGFEGFDRMKAALPDVPIVIVSGYSDKRTINAALERGASGFVPKTATGKTLIRALEGVLDGERYIPSSLLEENDAPSIFDQTAKRTGPIEDSPLNKLTEREAEALRLLIARKKLESELDRMANYDELTELPNRRHGRARLDEAVTWAQHIGGRVGFLIVDLEHFKTINDTLGHNVGDQLLIEAAWRLRGCADDGDTLMRLSGDEFGLVLGQHDSSRDLDWVVAAIIEAFEVPFLIEGHELFVGVNIGSAAYPDDADGPEQLLRCADLALYAAKRAGQTYSKFDNEIRSSVHRSAQISGLLRKALQRHEFILHYQPLVEASTREIVGAEALIRWNSQELGFVGPNHFIPVAEETGLIVPIGAWALEQACRDAAAWNRSSSRPLSVAVNISPKQLLAPAFHQTVADTLTRTGLSPELLKIEITESSLATDVDTCRRIIDALREMGIVLALDDFGTGYSALSYLQRFKFDILKLDQSFVRKTERGTSGAALTAAIIQMAKSLGMRTVGEGVETDDHVDLLQESGCDLMQGYLFSRPVKHEDFLVLAGVALSEAA